VQLLLVANRRATVEATWPSGTAHAQTPGSIDVPKGAPVKLVFSAAGYLPEVIELQAAATRAVTASLEPVK
jgi:hypothetical protein